MQAIKQGPNQRVVETRSHCQFASSFQPLCWRSGIKAFCTEAQNAGSGRKLTDDPIQLLPTLHSHWNLLGSLLKIEIPAHPLWGRGGREWISRTADEPGNLYFYRAPWGPSRRGAGTEQQCEATMSVTGPPGQEADEQNRRRLSPGCTTTGIPTVVTLRASEAPPSCCFWKRNKGLLCPPRALSLLVC